MAVEGTLDLFKLPEILQLISQQRKTGILTIQGQQDIVAISFLTGRIVAADALNTTLDEGLSQILLNEGMIRAPDLARAAAEHQSAGGRLIDLLVERRFIERTEVLGALRLQTFRLLEQLLRWNQGDFKFYSGDEVSYEEGFVPITVEELLFRSMQNVALALEPAAPARPTPLRPVPVPPPSSPGPLAPARAVAPPPAERAAPAPLQEARPAVTPIPRLVPVARPASPVAAPPMLLKREAPRVFRKTGIGTSPAPAWTGRALAALLAVLMVTGLLAATNLLMLPFPWQERDREGLARDQRAALYLKIDQAAKTWFLLKGSFPDHLDDLVAVGLLSSKDLKDSEGHRLQFKASEESYSLDPLAGDKAVAGAGASEAITGNFLLDPEFLNLPPEPSVQPLVLLD
jgi:hypothetical protein